MDKPVVVDLGEDPWARSEIANAYSAVRLAALERTLAAATLIVVATPELMDVFAPHGPVRLVPSVLPLDRWIPKAPQVPPTLGWWCDGRQRSGLEEVAPDLREVLVRTDTRMRQIGFHHGAPIMRGLIKKDEIAARAQRLAYFQADDLNLTAVANMKIFRDALAPCYLSLECYPPGSYAASASDIPLLRSAAMGVPTITTRSEPPPGAISARPDEWAGTILGVLEDPGKRRGLSLEARAWAETRTTHEAYEAVLEEVE